MGSRLVSADEARRLLADVSHTLPWRDYKYGILRSDDVPYSYVVSWDYAVSENDKGDAEQLFSEIIIKAPDLAATVIALSEELAAAESLALSWSTLAATMSNERDRLRDILACERGERAPEGWEAVTHGGQFVWVSANLCRGFALKVGKEWHWSPAPDVESLSFSTALEAIEAAEQNFRRGTP